MSFSPLPADLTSTWVRAVLEARQLRGQYFGKDKFSDPAWDILLETYAEHLDHELATLPALCAATETMESTVLRWLSKLEDDGLIVRQERADSMEGPVVGLTKIGVAAMERYFAAISRLAPSI